MADTPLAHASTNIAGASYGDSSRSMLVTFRSDPALSAQRGSPCNLRGPLVEPCRPVLSSQRAAQVLVPEALSVILSSLSVSRQIFRTGLKPNHWVVIFQDLEGYGSPADRYHAFHVHVETSPDTQQQTLFAIQERRTGAVGWTTIMAVANPLVPGSQLDFGFNHADGQCRLLAFSNGQGMIETTLQQPEPQANPAYDNHPALA